MFLKKLYCCGYNSMITTKDNEISIDHFNKNTGKGKSTEHMLYLITVINNIIRICLQQFPY